MRICKLEPIFNGETTKLVGWYCVCCRKWVEPIGREKGFTMETYK